MNEHDLYNYLASRNGLPTLEEQATNKVRGCIGCFFYLIVLALLVLGVVFLVRELFF